MCHSFFVSPSFFYPPQRKRPSGRPKEARHSPNAVRAVLFGHGGRKPTLRKPDTHGSRVTLASTHFNFGVLWTGCVVGLRPVRTQRLFVLVEHAWLL